MNPPNDTAVQEEQTAPGEGERPAAAGGENPLLDDVNPAQPALGQEVQPADYDSGGQVQADEEQRVEQTAVNAVTQALSEKIETLNRAMDAIGAKLEAFTSAMHAAGGQSGGPAPSPAPNLGTGSQTDGSGPAAAPALPPQPGPGAPTAQPTGLGALDTAVQSVPPAIQPVIQPEVQQAPPDMAAAQVPAGQAVPPSPVAAAAPVEAEKLPARPDIADDLRILYSAVLQNNVEQVLFKGTSHSTAVVALQTLLNELGYGNELNWDKYGADGQYGAGTIHALKAFAGTTGMPSDGETLSKELAQAMIGLFDDNWSKEAPVLDTGPAGGELAIREVTEKGKPRVIVSLGKIERKFVKFKKGIYTFGNQKVIDVINANKSSLMEAGLTGSAMNVMVAVSENEGNLDAINTWDNSFMTFGMFQWTIGARKDPGELPALIKKIKAADPNVFQKYYGRHGLDMVNTGAVSGFFTLNGKKIADPADKELLRTYEWAFYFWLSGQDPLVQRVEIQHSLSRINTFYRANGYKVNGHYIADLVTSEYGVGLLLDNHVNRPGYIKPCLAAAMENTGLSDPAAWGTSEEMRLIDAYLKIRETYGRSPMTHANKRAAVTRKYLDKGVISTERRSFQYGA
ncbi:MAG: hypothetical protein GY849_08155 [Deltaproteobacteria bacterium]|nr:hypothetical protein [Deltaproteobacteria bacterium]